MEHPSKLFNKSKPVYSTNYGATFCGDSIELLAKLPDNSVDLVVTSPPFALLRKKEYGNENQEDYLEWLSQFAKLILAKLKPTGSFVLDIGGAYKKGSPTRSLYNFRVAIHFVDVLKYHLAEEFYWFNPSKLPSPIEWVNKRKIRVKDAVNNVWWFSKTEFPKSDITKVLIPYSDRMKKLIEDPAKFYDAKKRPSGHDIGFAFGKDNGGAIPPNLLQIPNSESNSKYLAYCKKLGISSHPARFPSKLPKFFIDMLTDEGDLVVDIFAGSNTTGEAAELSKRRWLAFELNPEYCYASAFRFMDEKASEDAALKKYNQLLQGQPVIFANKISVSRENPVTTEQIDLF